MSGDANAVLAMLWFIIRGFPRGIRVHTIISFAGGTFMCDHKEKRWWSVLDVILRCYKGVQWSFADQDREGASRDEQIMCKLLVDCPPVTLIFPLNICTADRRREIRTRRRQWRLESKCRKSGKARRGKTNTGKKTRKNGEFRKFTFSSRGALLHQPPLHLSQDSNLLNEPKKAELIETCRSNPEIYKWSPRH